MNPTNCIDMGPDKDAGVLYLQGEWVSACNASALGCEHGHLIYA